MTKNTFFSISTILIIIFSLSCNTKHVDNQKRDKTLVIFHAGSLSNPMKDIIADYTKLNPHIKIITEIGGSVECARKITDLNKPCDVFVSADYKVIENMLIPKYTSWSISFATNEMVIVYRDDSKFASKIDSNNWFSILANNQVRVGRSDPNSDPCGYRTVLITKLAETYYKKPGLSLTLLENSKKDIRPKEVDLLALLETKNIDYLYIYKSIAIQHHLKFISLPKEINLSDSKFDAQYANATVTLKGATPETVKIQKGEAMQYAITIPKNGNNKALAVDFISFFLSKSNGLKTIKKHGQEILSPLKSIGYDSIPPEIKSIF